MTSVAPIPIGPIRAPTAPAGPPAAGGAAQAGATSATELLTTTDTAIDRIVADVDAATSTVDAEFFALLPDGPGARLADALERAARRGAHVRITLDGLGNVMVGFGSSKQLSLGASARMLDRLRAAGVEVHRAWRWSPHVGSRHTDHRKAVAIDGRVAYVGGMNFGKGTAGWTDAMVRATGPLARAVGNEEARRWTTFDSPALLPTSQGARATVESVDGYSLLRTSPDEGRTDIHDWYIDRINAARRRVWVASPAMFERSTIDAMIAAARRGVDVRYFSPGETLQGIPMLHSMIRAASAPLADAGAAVYELNGFAHVKALLVDDEATVGSFNVTTRSARHDHELNIASADPKFTGQVEKMLIGIQANSHRAAPLHGIEAPMSYLMRLLHIQY